MDDLRTFVDDLRARGITLEADGELLRTRPWSALSEAHREVIHTRWREIRDLVAIEGGEPETSAEASPSSESPPAEPEPKLSEREERARRMRAEGPFAYKDPTVYVDVALRNVDEKDMSSAEILAARYAFGARFGDRLERLRNLRRD